MSQRYKNRRYSFIIYLKSSQFIIAIEKSYKSNIYNNDDTVNLLYKVREFSKISYLKSRNIL